MSRHYLLAASFSLLVLTLDQYTKYLITKTFALHQSLPVIKNHFSIVHTRNTGIAFGLLAGADNEFRTAFLIATSLIAIAFIFYLLKNLAATHTYATVTLSLILGGAIGNLIDRIRWGAVIDFIDLHWYHYHWPAFNCADAAISLGLVLFLMGMLINKFPAK